MVTTAGTMSVAGAMLIGAAIGFGVEFFTQVTINGTPLEKVDWAKIAVSTIAGALSAIPGIGWWGAGLVMGGSQAAMSWIDGNDFKDVLLAFGIGFATGVVIYFASKVLNSLSKKIADKFRGSSQIADNPLYGKEYSDEVISKTWKDQHHNFPLFVDNFGSDGVLIENVLGDDGLLYDHLHIYGGYGQYEGRFEYIIDKNGVITHRFFKIIKS